MGPDFMSTIILFLLKAWAKVFGVLPRGVQITLGNSLGVLLFLAGVKRQIVDQNLEIYYRYVADLSRPRPLPSPTFSPLADPAHLPPSGWVPNQGGSDSGQNLKLEIYKGFGNLVLEVLLLFGPFQRFIKRNVEIRNFEVIQKAREGGQGILLLSSHVGNWEVMAAAAGVLVQIDLMLVTKRLKPAWLHRAIEKARLKSGVKGTYEPRTLKDILAHLSRGGSVGFVLDQYVGAPVGVRVPFLGVPVGTAYVVAAIAKRTGAQVIPVENYRLPSGKWVVAVGDPIPWTSHSDSHQELALNTFAYSREMERQLLHHPEQWLWFHRRFKGDLSPLRPDEWQNARIRK